MTETLTESAIERITAVNGRSCGECSLCCKLLDVPEVKKMPSEWCPHCRPGHGCQIYDRRPLPCRSYACLWLVNASLPDRWKPSRSHMVLDFHMMRATDQATLRVHVAREFADCWRREPYRSDLHKLAARGITTGRYRTVIIIDGKWTWLVLSEKEIAFDGKNPRAEIQPRGA